MMVIGKMIKQMVKDNIQVRVEQFLKGIGIMIYKMD